MTREQAIERLKECAACNRWITTTNCDTCWVNNHRCGLPTMPMMPEAVKILERAAQIGREADANLKDLRRILGVKAGGDV